MTTVLFDVAGPVARRRTAYGTVAGVLFLAAIFAVILFKLGSNGQLSPELWSVLSNQDLQTLLLRGLVATLQVAAISLLLSLAGGVVLAVGRLSHRGWVRTLSRIWIEIFRGLPLLLLIFFVFLGPPSVGINVPAFWALVISISIFNSAVIGEIIRAGIQSLPKGQMEAGYAIGLSRMATLRLILIPQGIRIVLPSLVAQLVKLLKDTSLGFIIGLEELLRSGRIAIEYLGGKYAIPVYTAIALFYLFTNMALAWSARKIERQTQIKAGIKATPKIELS
jgi:glutamate transport system permease protein